ncbi:kinase-like protein [Lyophyllum atratum]|nr:kinase-like protein [Lyophyllum atratum]
MLSAPAVDLTFDDDDWKTPPLGSKFYRAASVGSWGVTSIGRGFDWTEHNSDQPRSPYSPLDPIPCSPCSELDFPPKSAEVAHGRKHNHSFIDTSPIIQPLSLTPTTSFSLRMTSATSPTECPFVSSPIQSRPTSPRPPSLAGSVGSTRPPPSRSPSSPRPRRRSSRQRVSLVAGRVLIAPIEPPSPTSLLPHSLRRTDSSGSFLSVAASTGPPSPTADKEKESFLGGRSISDFVIEGEIGRGAYGLVKRAREVRADGSTGSPLVIKQIIKSRILADCWKKHPKHGTIPIEIYVMSAISNTSYILPPLRPWDPSRLASTTPQALEHQPTSGAADGSWVEGHVIKGHPNICPLLDFFEDNHFYYIVLPSTTPEQLPNEPPPPSDLFDLVETFPQGLPASSIRTYLGQIADALCFLHLQGIVHRDVKDENVVLGPDGKCILIDFGSSGLIKRNGWDTFSGTLDYAGPEILRGERYHGKEQDVWAFGVVAYVLLVGECPFMTAEETQEGLESPFANASIALDERCGEGKERDDEESDGGGSLGDAAALVRACLRVDVAARPTFERILQCRFLAGAGGWGMEDQ